MPNTQAQQHLALIKRRIPSSGEELPAVGLGTWQAFDVANNPKERAEAKLALQTFVRLGGRLVDSSPMYGSSEAVVGELTADLGVRQQLFLATKVWTSGRDAGLRQMESSIAKMLPKQTGPNAVLDLIQVHNLVDVETHLATLAEWKKAGLVRYVGVTHYARSAHAALETLIRRHAAIGLDFIQINYSMAEPEAAARVLPAAADAGIAVIINRPFAEGAMFDRIRGKALPAWASEIGAESWAQFFLKWILAQPAVTCAIPGTRNPKYVADNLQAATGALPDEDMRRRMVAHFASI